MIRTFIALPLPEEIKLILTQTVTDLRKHVPARWVRPEGMHLTLKFLGNIDQTNVTPIAKELDEVFQRYAPIAGTLDTLGAFPSPKRARVIWAGIGGDTQQMCALASEVDSVCSRYGIPAESRPFAAHITLGRLKVPSMLELEKAIPAASFTIFEGHFYQSELLREGARYTVLHASRLGR